MCALVHSLIEGTGQVSGMVQDMQLPTAALLVPLSASSLLALMFISLCKV